MVKPVPGNDAAAGKRFGKVRDLGTAVNRLDGQELSLGMYSERCVKLGHVTEPPRPSAR